MTDDFPPFEEVFRSHRDRIYRYLLLQVRRAADAEDLTADVFLAAYLAYERVAPPPERVHLWLFRIARNRANNWRRHLAVVTRTLPHLVAGEARTVEDQALVAEDIRRVRDSIRQLRPRDRQLLALRIGGDLSHAEVAVLLGISESAAVMGTKRALQRIRERMVAAGWTPL